LLVNSKAKRDEWKKRNGQIGELHLDGRVGDVLDKIDDDG